MHYYHSNQPTTAGTAVLTVSDTRTLHDDKSGKEIQNLLKSRIISYIKITLKRN
ncbi:hypothetical protein [Metabacillus idriensis]|uniref:hypothetical protein n=1 Tax=Metabacillus idriensis TaxID=324768 RepID=UPI00174C9059|nr:hypothetical protein [Metabacillus idriensis]